jgi:LPXTG-motif cell wall-anchored protein
MKKLYILLWCILHVWTNSLWSQEGISVSASLDKNAIVIGEQLHLNLQANFPQTVQPFFFTIDSLAHFEMLNRSKIDTQTTDKGIQLQQTITLTSWDSGTWQIPAFRLPDSRSARTQTLAVQVNFSPMDPNQPYHDVKDILNVQQPGRTTWYWYVIGAILLLLLFLLLFPKKKKEAAAPVSHPDAYRQAITQLEKLKKEKATDGKLYFTELVLIFRNYLQQRKGIQSHSKTTDDLSRQIRQLKLKEANYNTLVQTLQLSDFVKFAQYDPTPEEKEDALETIKKTIVQIEQTKA